MLNRDEILHRFYKDWEHDWRTNDYDIDADYEFLVLAAMVALGEIEIDFPGGKNIHAANLREIIDMPTESFYSFSHVSRPKNMNTAAVRELFLAIITKDYTSRINDPSIYPELVSKAKQLAAEAVKMSHDVANGIYLENIETCLLQRGVRYATVSQLLLVYATRYRLTPLLQRCATCLGRQTRSNR